MLLLFGFEFGEVTPGPFQFALEARGRCGTTIGSRKLRQSPLPVYLSFIIHTATHLSSRKGLPQRRSKMGQPIRLFTIGYEGATVDEVLTALRAAGVAQVADVRAIAASRRPGFAKSALAANLASAEIGYRHLRALGTPKEGRDAAKKGDRATLARVYAGQLELPEAQAQAEMLKAMVAEQPTALLCFERDPSLCHRTLLWRAALPDAEVIDLIPGELGR